MNELDIVHGMFPGRLSNLPVMLVLVGWLYGILELAESGAFFFARTLLALGVTADFSVILSVCGLWSLHRGRLSPPSPTPRGSRA
jgi:hypothetical protein